MRTKEFSIESGMSCQSCANRLEKGLLKRADITYASVNFATKNCAVTSALTQEEIVSVAKDLGFGLNFKEDFEAYFLREQRADKEQKLNLLLAFIFSLPVIFFHMVPLHMMASYWHQWDHAILYSLFLQFVCSAFVIFYCGRSFFVHAYGALKNKSTNMDVLVVLSASCAWLYSTFFLVKQDVEHVSYFETAVMLVFFILIGKYLEEKSKRKANGSLRSLARLKPTTATLVHYNLEPISSESYFQASKSVSSENPELESVENSNQKISDKEQESSVTLLNETNDKQKTEEFVSIPIQHVKVDQVLLVKAGEKIPADGVVIKGESEVDFSFLTGEFKSVFVQPNSTVVGGGFNLTSAFYLKVTQVGEDSQLEKIIRLVERAQHTRLKPQKLADLISQLFIPFVLALALATCLGWLYFSHSFERSLMASLAVLAVACPCALGLATPMCVLRASNRAAKQGIFIRDMEGLENLRHVKSFLFDKTGTLTEGKLEVLEKGFLDMEKELRFFAMLKTVCSYSTHPVSKCLSQFLEAEHPHVLPSGVEEVREIPGKGLTWKMGEEKYYFGKLEERSLTENEGFWIEDIQSTLEMESSPSVILENGVLCGAFFLADKIRPSAYEVLSFLKQKEILTCLVTGDGKRVARDVSASLQIDKYYGEQTPAQKLSVIQKFKDSHPKVAFVGDGINDAAALSEADVGFAMGSGTQVAGECAHFLLQKNDLSQISFLFELANRTNTLIYQNLFFAFSYNVVLIPLAVFGQLNPMIAAACMSLSSLIVVLNSLR
jgi:Cu+-exporting ATPase